jgi:hypothetical protein
MSLGSMIDCRGRLPVSAKSSDGGASNIVLIVLAVIGVLALLAAGGMLIMHWGMGAMMGR